MNKYIILSFFVLPFILNGCSTADTPNDAPSVIPQISVQSISYPSFTKSVWNQVIGGTALIEFDLKDENNAVVSRSTDSTDLKNILTYTKVLSSGTYDLHVSSKVQTKVADTFLRFNAVVKSLSVQNKVAASLVATTTDGLITIGKSFVQDNTIPVFTVDGASTSYKLGLINGFYYLYVTNGTKGTLSFTAKATGQKASKSLTITDQSNIEVVASKGSLSIVFADFSYNQVAVNSSTLISLNLTPFAYGVNSSTYFVLTDEVGTLLNEVKLIVGTSNIKITSLIPFTKDRFNLYVITIPTDPNTMPQIRGYLQIKKGSIYVDSRPSQPYKESTQLNLTYGDISFDKLLMSTEYSGQSITSVADTTYFKYLSITNTRQIYVQALKNNQSRYNFFDLPEGTTNYKVDLTKLTKTSLVKSITAPGDNFTMDVYAKQDVNFGNSFFLGRSMTQGKTVDFYYPSESFAEYTARMNYSIGSKYYTIVTTGREIPDQVENFDASFSVSGSNLSNFTPSVSGTFDYYTASFQNPNVGSNLSVILFSPSAGNYKSIKTPDFSKYLGTSIDLSQLKLNYFSLHQTEFYNEGQLIYHYSDYNSKMVSQSF